MAMASGRRKPGPDEEGVMKAVHVRAAGPVTEGRAGGDERTEGGDADRETPLPEGIVDAGQQAAIGVRPCPEGDRAERRVEDPGAQADEQVARQDRRPGRP